jgi:phosphatidylinositol glycan class V
LLHCLTAGLLARAQQQQQQAQKQDHLSHIAEQLITGGRSFLSPSAAAVGFLSPSVVHFLYPWAFMAACAALVMHVQVATRFLSCCPALYWFMASLWVGDGVTICGKTNSTADTKQKGKDMVDGSVVPDTPMDEQSGNKGAAVWLWGWSLAFLSIGSVMFPNFYPWT